MREEVLRSFAGTILCQYLGKSTSILQVQRLTGGCINESYKIVSRAGDFFLKHNQAKFEIQFKKEADSLSILRETGTLDVPEVLQIGTHENRAYLLMEFIQPKPVSHEFWEKLGANLAKLHRTTPANQKFGLTFDNYIGELPQKNDFKTDWIEFFIENRLEPQATLARDNQLISDDFLKRFHKFYNELPALLPEEPPSLIHGDLWSGNFLSGPNGQAVLIDPAIYFGNREIELAFTHLFGGFSPEFYASYQRTWPLAPGFQERVEIHNLYPLLVHVNLFGTSYLTGVEKVIRKYT
ncbi:MAG: fructosamine kinase family protein [Cytophagales bacterium]|nr:fructosamine kinase family protein [Cytophagales bacterium]